MYHGLVLSIVQSLPIFFKINSLILLTICTRSDAPVYEETIQVRLGTSSMLHS